MSISVSITIKNNDKSCIDYDDRLKKFHYIHEIDKHGFLIILKVCGDENGSKRTITSAYKDWDRFTYLK